MTLREWLAANGDDVTATIFVSVVVAALVGFRKRSTGVAIFLSGASAATLSLIAYPVLTSWGYDWRAGVSILGPLAGACSWAIFGILMKISDRLEARNTELADKLINKGASFIPGDGGPP